MVTNN